VFHKRLQLWDMRTYFFEKESRFEGGLKI